MFFGISGPSCNLANIDTEIMVWALQLCGRALDFVLMLVASTQKVCEDMVCLVNAAVGNNALRKEKPWAPVKWQCLLVREHVGWESKSGTQRMWDVTAGQCNKFTSAETERVVDVVPQ